MLATADLAGYAGQFVWLELNYDDARNRAFLEKYGAGSTPTFFIIDARDGHVAASQTGAMSLDGLKQFLGRAGAKQSPAETALVRGDALLALKPAEAAAAYLEALRLAPAGWPERELAEGSLAVALQNSRQWQTCAETAAAEAAGMSRGTLFARTVVAGMWCLVSPEGAPWSKELAARLEPLATEALSLSTTVRDHRDELFRTLMYLALSRNDKATAAKWGDRWLAELDAIHPANDEERSAVDIARVENIGVFGDPQRILPALMASERAMPGNWNASLRVAQMEGAAGQYDAAIAACDRGLARAPGPVGRTWLLQTKGNALKQKGLAAEARHTLEEALQAAQTIPSESSRGHTVGRIRQALGRDSKIP